MAPPAVVTTNVLIGEARMYTAPTGTVAPLDTLAAGNAWLTPWVFSGATEEGTGFAVGTNTTDIMIEEQATPVAVTMTSSNVRLIVVLAEDTVETMKLAYGGGTITTVAAASGIIGKKTLVLADTLSTMMAGFESTSPAGLFRRVIVPKVISIADVTTQYRRAANNRSYAIELRAICARSEITVVDQTAVALP